MNENPVHHLIIKAQRGDMNAFRLLVEKYQGFVYRVAYRLVGIPNDAEDLSQEAFIRVWKNLSQYNPDIKITTWLYKIVTNLSLDLLKSRQHKTTRSTVSIDKPSAEIPSGNQADEELIRRELEKAIADFSESLTPRQKAVFVLRDIEGLDVTEIAAILNMNAGNIKSNLYYARCHMSNYLKRYYAVDKNEQL